LNEIKGLCIMLQIYKRNFVWYYLSLVRAFKKTRRQVESMIAI